MEETKRCPYCGEEILAIAKKCKHCGEWLETKEPVKEKKACPVCGEAVDADIEVCPYCKEPTHFGIKKDIADNQHHMMDINNGTYLYCKTCKEKISASASTCPKCGDDDPFYFKDIKKTRKSTNLGCAAMLCIAIILNIIFQCSGSNNGLLSWSRTEENIFFVVLALVFGLGKVFSYHNTKAHKEEMEQIFQSKHDNNARGIWQSKLNEND